MTQTRAPLRKPQAFSIIRGHFSKIEINSALTGQSVPIFQALAQN
jgi:hypothetical protein